MRKWLYHKVENSDQCHTFPSRPSSYMHPHWPTLSPKRALQVCASGSNHSSSAVQKLQELHLTSTIPYQLVKVQKICNSSPPFYKTPQPARHPSQPHSLRIVRFLIKHLTKMLNYIILCSPLLRTCRKTFIFHINII